MSALRSIAANGLLLTLALGLVACATDDPARWASQVEAFEAGDAVESPPPGGIVFVGSSSVRLWDLGRYFPDLPVIKRAVGGTASAASGSAGARAPLGRDYENSISKLL